jgi:hypothetical protein
MADWLIFSLLALSSVVGTSMTAVRLPGTWLILAAAIAYLWHAGWPAGTGTLLLVVGGAAVAGEILELLTSLVLARRVGASRYASWGGVAGGLLGAIFLSFVVPIFPIGTIVGALLGCFLGAAIAELAANQRLVHGTRVGLAAAIGFAVGMAAKVAVALAMSLLLLAHAWPGSLRTPDLRTQPDSVAPQTP